MALKSWLESANDPDCGFPIQNLPYGVFRTTDRDHIGVAIGDRILDLHSCAAQGLFRGLSEAVVSACSADVLNPLMALGKTAWVELRSVFTALLSAGVADGQTKERVERSLIPMGGAVMRLPAAIGDYTDFYASIHHATRVGQMFRPANPLLPNYKYVPIGYHGRASSIVVSGGKIRRPCGQTKAQEGEPVFGPTKSLDYELEVGMFIGPGNGLGEPIPVSEAEDHIFGLCIVNDWSARDIQSWEYQPLGPFLAKSFATTVSPWVVTLEALEPYRVPAFVRPEGDPAPLAYLQSPSFGRAGIDLSLEVYIQSSQMRSTGLEPCLLGRSNLRYLYWTLAQLLTHHTSNGCNLRPGDLLATGTVSGPDAGSEGCLLEKQRDAEPLHLPNGEVRRFLQDGDQVTLRAFCQKPGLPRIGFGECSGTVVSA
jgi:fumarylacetoacetase